MGIRNLALFDADGVILFQGGLVEDIGKYLLVKGGIGHDISVGLEETA
jgi:hypothetical protein